MSAKEITPEGHAALMGGYADQWAARRDERICLSWWLPRVEKAGLPVPETHIVRTDVDLLVLLDGEEPAGFDTFHADLARAVERIGTPCFLRSGQTSGKHEWSATCYLADREKLTHHVAMIVQYSAMADLMGLPVDVWCVRRLISTRPLFTCNAYLGFPVVREFRFFADERRVTHVQPYWPGDSCEAGQPDDPEWRYLLGQSYDIADAIRRRLGNMAVRAAKACGGGEWSVDFLEDATGNWWLTDMAPGVVSFRWSPQKALRRESGDSSVTGVPDREDAE